MDDMFDKFDIQAPRRHVRRDQNCVVSAFESADGTGETDMASNPKRGERGERDTVCATEKD